MMSQAFRIRISESIHKVIRASDHVRSQLEVLSVLPEEQMAELLAAELEKQGYVRDGDIAVKEEDGVKITVNLPNGEVKVEAESQEEVDLETTREGHAYDDAGPGAAEVEKKLREQAKAGLEKTAELKTDALQKQVTDQLEQALGDVRQQLDRAVNKATAEALKIKAKQMGNIKTISEDADSGSLTIVVEV